MGKIRISEQEEAIEAIIEAKMEAAKPEIKGRKRMLIARYGTYMVAKKIEADLINDGADPAHLQVRRHAGWFGLYRREWVK